MDTRHGTTILTPGLIMQKILLLLFTSVLNVSPAAAERDGGRREGEDQPSHGVRSLRGWQEGH